MRIGPTEPKLRTIGRVAEELGAPVWRVDYAVRTRRITPAARAGRLRLWDAAGVERIRAALAEIREVSR